VAISPQRPASWRPRVPARPSLGEAARRRPRPPRPVHPRRDRAARPHRPTSRRTTRPDHRRRRADRVLVLAARPRRQAAHRPLRSAASPAQDPARQVADPPGAGAALGHPVPRTRPADHRLPAQHRPRRGGRDRWHRSRHRPPAAPALSSSTATSSRSARPAPSSSAPSSSAPPSNANATTPQPRASQGPTRPREALRGHPQQTRRTCLLTITRITMISLPSFFTGPSTGSGPTAPRAHRWRDHPPRTDTPPAQDSPQGDQLSVQPAMRCPPTGRLACPLSAGPRVAAHHAAGLDGEQGSCASRRSRPRWLTEPCR